MPTIRTSLLRKTIVSISRSVKEPGAHGCAHIAPTVWERITIILRRAYAPISPADVSATPKQVSHTLVVLPKLMDPSTNVL